MIVTSEGMMSVPDDRVDLSNFKTELRKHNHGLSPAGWARYLGNSVPDIIFWLVEYPNLIDALREDARAWHRARVVVEAEPAEITP